MAAKRVRKIKVTKKPVRTLEKLPWPRQDTNEDGVTADLGVDVAAKREDIVKIVYKFFKVPNISMEELLQEVFLAIIHKNHTRSAHDPRKSSFGHYVYMVARNVCINLVHRKKRFEREKDSLDAPQGHDDNRTLLDTIEPAIPEDEDGFYDLMDEVEIHCRKQGLWDVARYVRAARTGAPPDIIREAMTWGDRKVTTKTIRDIRNQVKNLAAAAVIPSMALN
jgi:DNA-directed RNA polymerase specialized sigma24 family protein